MNSKPTGDLGNDDRKRIVLLGATGSIGSSTLKVLRAHPDKLRLVGVAAASSTESLAAICKEFAVPHAVLTNEASYKNAVDKQLFPTQTHLRGGMAALDALAPEAGADCVLVATTGTTSLRPALSAIAAGIDIALANKELLVLGGAHVMEAAKRNGIRLLPTDSEHNALFQCLNGQPSRSIARLILTASGGQFRERAPETLAQVTPEEATQHPNWSMGRKITVDSATMANKGLELIEAHWLFGVQPEQLEVVIHPQSIVHSMVEFVDHSTLAQLSPPSMTFAIQNCLLYPERHPGTERGMDFSQALSLDFHLPDPNRYPCLALAKNALAAGDDRPAVFNAANEVAVERFLAKELGFLEIAECIAFTLERCALHRSPSLGTLLAADQEARRLARTFSSCTTQTTSS